MLTVVRFGSAPDARDGGQVVRADRRHGLVRPALARLSLEPEQPVTEGADLLKRRLDRRLDEPEVLADHERARATALRREHREERRRWIADVSAGRRAAGFGDPEQPEQGHHMVEAQALRVSGRRTDGVDERLEMSGLQLPWIERRHA